MKTVRFLLPGLCVKIVVLGIWMNVVMCRQSGPLVNWEEVENAERETNPSVLQELLTKYGNKDNKKRDGIKQLLRQDLSTLGNEKPVSDSIHATTYKRYVKKTTLTWTEKKNSHKNDTEFSKRGEITNELFSQNPKKNGEESPKNGWTRNEGDVPEGSGEVNTLMRTNVIGYKDVERTRTPKTGVSSHFSRNVSELSPFLRDTTTSLLSLNSTSNQTSLEEIIENISVSSPFTQNYTSSSLTPIINSNNDNTSIPVALENFRDDSSQMTTENNEHSIRPATSLFVETSTNSERDSQPNVKGNNSLTTINSTNGTDDTRKEITTDDVTHSQKKESDKNMTKINSSDYEYTRRTNTNKDNSPQSTTSSPVIFMTGKGNRDDYMANHSNETQYTHDPSYLDQTENNILLHSISPEPNIHTSTPPKSDYAMTFQTEPNKEDSTTNKEEYTHLNTIVNDTTELTVSGDEIITNKNTNNGILSTTSILSAETIRSLDNPITDLNNNEQSTLSFPNHNGDNLITFSSQSLHGLPETYPTVTESISHTTFHFTNEEDPSDRTHRTIRVRRTTTKHTRPYRSTSQETPSNTPTGAASTSQQNKSSIPKNKQSNMGTSDTDETTTREYHSTLSEDSTNKDKDINIRSTEESTKHNNKSRTDHIFTGMSDTLPLATNTKEALAGWNKLCSHGSQCAEGFVCLQGRTEADTTCVCQSPEVYSPFQEQCKPEQYWTNVSFSTKMETRKRLKVSWQLKSPDAARDVDKYTVKYCRSFRACYSPLTVEAGSDNSTFLSTLSPGAQYTAYVSMTLKNGNSLSSDKFNFTYCYNSIIKTNRINQSFQNSQKVSIKLELSDGCSSKLNAFFTNDNDHTNTFDVVLKSNYGCKDGSFTKTVTFPDLRQGSTYSVEYRLEPSCPSATEPDTFQQTFHTIPAPPTGLKIVKHGSTYLTVVWKHPTEGNVEYYNFRFIHNGKKSNDTIRSNVSTYNVTGLDTGREYNIDITAVYYGKYSTRKTLKETTTRYVPSRLKNFLWKKKKTKLIWKPNDRKYATIEYYIVQYNCSKSDNVYEQTKRRELDFSKRDDECCIVKASAVSSKGEGEPRLLTLEPSVPSIKESPIDNANQASNGYTTDVSWNMSKQTKTGAIYKFKVKLQEKYRRVVDTIVLYCKGDSCINPCYHQLPSSAETFEPQQVTFEVSFSVKPNTEYDLEISMFTAKKELTKYRKRLSFTTPETPPTSAISNFSLKIISTDRISAFWYPPTESNGDILKYNVSLDYLTQDCSTSVSSDSRYTPTKAFRILPSNTSRWYFTKELLPFTNYTMSVAAINSAGQSKSWSKPVIFTTNPEGSSVRRIIPKNIYSRSIELSWMSPCPITEPIPFYSIDVDCNNNSSKTLTTPDTSILITDLQPDTVYSISVKVGKNGIRTKKQVTTKIDAPGPVNMFTLTQEEQLDKERRLYVNWSSPLEPNGNITGYVVMVNFDKSRETINTTTTLLSLPAEPETNYSVKIIAKTAAGAGPVEERSIFINAGVLPKPMEMKSQPLVHHGESCSPIDFTKTVPLNLPMSFLCNTSFGKIKYRGVLVMKEVKGAKDSPEPTVDLHPHVVHQQQPYQLRESNHMKQNSKPYHIVYLSSHELPCNMKKRGVSIRNCATSPGVFHFLIGTEPHCTKSRCNKFLDPGSRYRFKAFVCTSAGCTVTLKSRVIQTEAEKADKSGLVIGVVIAIIIIILCVIITVLSYHYRQRVVKLIRRCQRLPEVDNEAVELEPVETPSRPILLEGLVSKVERMHQDSNIMFSEEYKLVTQLSYKGETTIAQLPTHRAKNRYSNVLPFDHARVKLLPLDDDEPSDYINASFIPGQRGPREYIAAQGPLKGTIDDFWRMVWEKRVNAVVMLTQCMEKGKVKCEQYWPADPSCPEMYGDLQIQLRSESVLPDYIIRVIDLELGSHKRTVHQFHFLKWPDFGCPEKTYLLLNLVRAVRDHTPHNPHSPMIIHCSAGVGRSGTYIALDTLLQQIKEPGRQEIDIFNLVLNMRKNRPMMVQRENQYIYIHDCLRDAMLNQSEEENSVNDDEHIYQNTSSSPTTLEDV